MTDKLERVPIAGNREVHGSWYRGKDCNVNPYKEDLQRADALEEYILKGWLPAAPWLTKEMLVTTFGSCFADNINNYLTAAGYKTTRKAYDDQSHIIRYGDGIVNTHSMWQQFAWAWENVNPREELWHGWAGDVAESGEEVRLATKAIFDATDVFVLTLGLSEVWMNKITREVFWRAIPKGIFDPGVHGFRVLSCEENQENIEATWQLIKKHRPEAKVIFTLSPVPLVATFRPVSCVTANEVSKSCLRVALDQFLRGHWGSVNRDLFYWPSYEIVRGHEDPYEKDNRHVRMKVVEEIMRAFIKHYCKEAS